MVIGTRKGLDPGFEMNIQIEQDQLKVSYILFSTSPS